MAYYSQPLPNNLGLALQLWNNFRSGGVYDQEKAGLQGAQQENVLRGLDVAQKQQTWNDAQAVRNASQQATDSLLTPQPGGAVKPFGAFAGVLPELGNLSVNLPGASAPYTPDSLKFYSEMTPAERQQSLAPFSGVPDIMKPDTYDAWVSRQTNRLPPIKYPSNFGALFNNGGAGAGSPAAPVPEQDYTKPLSDIPKFGRRSVWVPKMTPEGKLQPTEVAAPLGPDQTELLMHHPEAVESHFDEIQQPEARQFVQYRDTKIKSYQDQVANNPSINQWLGSGKDRGMQQILAKIDSIVRPHLGPDGQFKTPLSGQEGVALIYATGAMDNPGMGVRDNEFERVFKTQGWADRARAEMESIRNGNKVSPDLVQDIVNLAHTTGGAAKELAYKNLSGIAQNAQAEGIDLDRLIPDKAARTDFENWRGIQSATAVGSEAEAKALPVGSYAKFPDGRVFRVNPDKGRSDGKAQTPAARKDDEQEPIPRPMGELNFVRPLPPPGTSAPGSSTSIRGQPITLGPLTVAPPVQAPAPWNNQAQQEMAARLQMTNNARRLKGLPLLSPAEFARGVR